MNNTVLKESRTGIGNVITVSVTETRDIEITEEMLLDFLEKECSSNSMARIINALGEMNEKYQSTTCWAAKELTENGVKFIEDMKWFLGEKTVNDQEKPVCPFCNEKMKPVLSYSITDYKQTSWLCGCKLDYDGNNARFSKYP